METSNSGGGVATVTRGRNAGARVTRSFGQQLQTSLVPAHNGGSWHIGFMVENPYTYVRAVIRNQEATGYTMSALAFAASNNVTTPVTGTTPVIATFGGATSFAIPARLAANRPSITYSDWMPLTAVIASSGTGLYPFHARAYIAVGPFSYSGGSTTISQWKQSAASPLIKNRYAICAVALGDFVSSNWAGYTGYDDTTSLSPVLEFEFITNTKAITVCAVGDSIMWGGVGSLDMVGGGFLACATISTAARPVYWCNASVPSTTTTQFVTRLSDMFTAGVRPQIVVYQSFSRNDGTPTAATIGVNRENLYRAIELCVQYGAIPIIDTGTAETAAAWTATQDNFRKAFRDEVIALCAARSIPVINSDSVWSDQATPARYIPAYTTDGTHPNDAGQAIVSPLWQTAINSVASQLF